MLNPETNSNRRQSSTFMETLQDKLKDIKNFSNWSAKEQMVAVTTVGVIFGALFPVVAVALPVAAAGAAVALTLFFAVKAVEYGYKGLKWSAEKTWEGARYTAGKIKAGAVYAKDSVKKGAHLVNKRTKEKASNMLEATADKLYRAAGNEDYLNRIDDEFVPNSPQKENFRKIREDLKAIFASGEDNFKLVKSILSGISSKIEEKIKAREKEEFTSPISVNDSVENAGLTLRWEKQKRFVDDLSVDKLQSLVTQRSLPKDNYFIRSIFSEHYSEIKEVIKERKIGHKISESLENLNKVARKNGRRVSSTQPTPLSLSRSSSMDSLNSVRTNSTDGSTVGLLTGEHKEVKAPTSFWDRFLSPFKSGKKSEQPSNIQYQPPFESDAMPSAKIGNSIFYVDLSEPPKAPGSPTTSGYGSKRSSPISSGSSTPKLGQNPSLKEEFDAEFAKRLEKLSKSSSGSSTPPKPPVPPKPLAGNLANEQKKQQGLSTPRSNSPDSGRDSSGSSTPTGRQSPINFASPTPMMLTDKGGRVKTQDDLKKTGRLDKLVGQPSTEIDVDTDVQHQTAPKFVA